MNISKNVSYIKRLNNHNRMFLGRDFKIIYFFINYIQIGIGISRFQKK